MRLIDALSVQTPHWGVIMTPNRHSLFISPMGIWYLSGSNHASEESVLPNEEKGVERAK